MAKTRDTLDEIRGMARADHAYRMGRELNPYAADTPEGRAWYAGWDEEEASEHKLDEEMAKLLYFRVRTHIVAGNQVLAEIKRGHWSRDTVSGTQTLADGMLFNSREVQEKYPDRSDVRIRATYERAPKGGVED